MALADRWEARIVVVDDDRANLMVLQRALARGGHSDVHTFDDARTALADVATTEPDLVVVDLHMPGMDGFAFMELVDRLVAPGTYLPFLVLTGDDTADARVRSFRSGACDLLTKPVDPAALRERVDALLDTRLLNQRLRSAASLGSSTETSPPDRSLPRRRASDDAGAVERIVRALAVCDDEPASVNRRVGALTRLVAEGLGLPPAFAHLLGRAALLHDIGKVAADDARPGPWAHAEAGRAILAGLADQPVFELARPVAAHHHERWDGSGGPAGLAGEEIPLVARIVAAADLVASVEHHHGLDAAKARLRTEAGTGLDPAVVDVALAVLDDPAGGPALGARTVVAEPVRAR